MVMPQI